MSDTESTTTPAEESTLSYRTLNPDSVPHGSWAKLVRVVAVLGVGIAVGRCLRGYDGVRTAYLFGLELWTHGDRYSLLTLISIITGLTGVGLLVCAIGCFCGKVWSRSAIILNEFAAMVVIVLSTVAIVVDHYAFSEQAPVQELIFLDIAQTSAFVVLQLAFPILAIAIVRSREARQAFGGGGSEDPADEPEESGDPGEAQITP